MAKVCVLLADGFEEIEALTAVDVLRRADVETSMVGVLTRDVRGAHDIVVKADCLLSETEGNTWDLVYLPGGMPGATHLRDDPQVQRLIRAQTERGGYVSAICAAPIALESAGVLRGKRATSYPSVEKQLSSLREYTQERVVVDGKLITSRGPATAMELALELVTVLCGREKAESVARAMLVR